MLLLMYLSACGPSCKSDISEVEAFNTDFRDEICEKLMECGHTAADCLAYFDDIRLDITDISVCSPCNFGRNEAESCLGQLPELSCEAAENLLGDTPAMPVFCEQARYVGCQLELFGDSGG